MAAVGGTRHDRARVHVCVCVSVILIVFFPFPHPHPHPTHDRIETETLMNALSQQLHARLDSFFGNQQEALNSVATVLLKTISIFAPTPSHVLWLAAAVRDVTVHRHEVCVQLNTSPRIT